MIWYECIWGQYVFIEFCYLPQEGTANFSLKYIANQNFTRISHWENRRKLPKRIYRSGKWNNKYSLLYIHNICKQWQNCIWIQRKVRHKNHLSPDTASTFQNGNIIIAEKMCCEDEVHLDHNRKTNQLWKTNIWQSNLIFTLPHK